MSVFPQPFGRSLALRIIAESRKSENLTGCLACRVSVSLRAEPSVTRRVRPSLRYCATYVRSTSSPCERRRRRRPKPSRSASHKNSSVRFAASSRPMAAEIEFQFHDTFSLGSGGEAVAERALPHSSAA